MNLTLKMNIQDQEFELNANLTNNAGRIYRQQFSRDILKDMSDIYKKMHKSPFDGINLTGLEINGKNLADTVSEWAGKLFGIDSDSSGGHGYANGGFPPQSRISIFRGTQKAASQKWVRFSSHRNKAQSL